MPAPNSTRARRLSWLVGVVWLAALLAAPLAWAETPSKNKPPETRRDNVKEVLHGVEVVDPYRWLEDQESPETRAWIDAQNEYTKSILDPWPGREALKQRITELLKVDVIGVPLERNGRYFFTKRLAGQDLSVIYVRRGLKGGDQVLVDPHPLSPDHRTSVSLQAVSDDGSLLAYGIRQGGEDEIAVRLLNVDTRKELPDQLAKARYFGLSFKPDRSGFYYTRHEEEGPRVYYHALGGPDPDQKIFGDGYGPEKIIFASVSDDGRYLLVHVLHGSAGKTELHFQDLVAGGPVTPIVADLDARFFGEIGGDRLFVRTDWEAPNWRVLAVNLGQPAREHWKEIIPQGDSVMEDISLAGGKLFANYLENVRSVVKVFGPDGHYERSITFPALGTVSGLSGRWDKPEAFYLFTSFHIPTTIYRYEVPGGTQEIWAQLKVPVDTSKFAVRQVWYESKDRTLVPMFLVHQKGLRLDGSNPTLLTGYGGFNLSTTPTYSSLAVAWVERGGVYALANLRRQRVRGEMAPRRHAGEQTERLR